MKKKEARAVLEALLAAIKAGDTETCRELIANGVDVNGDYSTGEGPLHFAASWDLPIEKSLLLCKMLIDAGAAVGMRSDAGFTPLYKAASAGHPVICEFFLDQGADVNEITKYQSTPLHAAASYGGPATCQFLINRGANVNAVDHVGRTPLHCGSSNEATVALLLSAGANPHVRTHTGETPLYNSGNKRSAAACRLLVAKGLSPSEIPSRPHKGFLTPFQFAVNAGHTAVVQYYLEECSEDAAQRTIAGRTMMQLAKGYDSIKELLRAAKTSHVVSSAVAHATGEQPAPAQKASGLPTFGAL